MNGAIVATAIVQIGVVFAIHRQAGYSDAHRRAAGAPGCAHADRPVSGCDGGRAQRAEEGLRQTLRLAAAGEMAGAIAHEVNQPLTAVANYGRSAQMLLERDRSGLP